MRDGELVDALGDAGEAARRLSAVGGIGLLEMRPQPGGACEASLRYRGSPGDRERPPRR